MSVLTRSTRAGDLAAGGAAALTLTVLTLQISGAQGQGRAFLIGLVALSVIIGLSTAASP